MRHNFMQMSAAQLVMHSQDAQIQIEALERGVEQRQAVINELNRIIGEQRAEIENLSSKYAGCGIQYSYMSDKVDKQSALIESLADTLKCVDGGHTEHGWLGEMGKIEMWRVNEALALYEEYK